MKIQRLLPTLWPITVALVILLPFIFTGQALAYDPSPHTGVYPPCFSCHLAENYPPYAPIHCSTCHNGINAPKVSTHGNGTGGAEVPFQLGCDQCHNPHGTGNLSLIRTESVRVNLAQGVLVPTVFTSRTGPNSFDDGTNSGICVVCHINPANPPGDGMTNHPGGDHGSGINYQGQDCTLCHSHADGFVHGGGSGGDGCIECHGHDKDTLYDPDASFPYTAGITPSKGVGSYQSHSTHTETDSDDQKGPGIYCDICHDTGSFPYFKSGTDGNGDGKYNLAETDVCNNCHSDGGAYNGVTSAGDSIGAKDN